jgi:hypothetical protein
VAVVEGGLQPRAEVPTLTGRRLGLEPLGVEHAAEMAIVHGDPSLHRFIGGAPANRGELVRTYRRLLSAPAGKSQR